MLLFSLFLLFLCLLHSVFVVVDVVIVSNPVSIFFLHAHRHVSIDPRTRKLINNIYNVESNGSRRHELCSFTHIWRVEFCVWTICWVSIVLIQDWTAFSNQFISRGQILYSTLCLNTPRWKGGESEGGGRLNAQQKSGVCKKSGFEMDAKWKSFWFSCIELISWNDIQMTS